MSCLNILFIGKSTQMQMRKYSWYEVLGWPKSPLCFFHKIKDTFFIFTSNFIDLDILNMSAVSCYWLLLGRGWGAAKHLPMHMTAPQRRIIWPKCQQYKKLSKLLLTYLISHSTFSIHSTNLFLSFRCIFTFLGIIKHNVSKMLRYRLSYSILKWLHKNSSILMLGFF